MSDSPFVDLDDTDFGPTMRGHQPGDRLFGRFVLKRLLGRGGMGVVWLALDEDLKGDEVALKFTPNAVRFDDAAVEELRAETLRGRKLAHPNIVRIYDFFSDEAHAAIAMEFVDGETLSKLRVAQPNKVFEPRQIEHWVRQLTEGMAYAHRSAKIVHRDLKPPNLIIDQDGNLKIMDFGIARSIQDSMLRVTMAGNSTGTLAYMSPQQAWGKPASVADDIYAFGSTLYELFTGKPPFYSGDLSRQLSDELPPPIADRRCEFGLQNIAPFPESWNEVIQRCLAKQPESRPADFDEVRHLLGLEGGAGRGQVAQVPVAGSAPPPAPGNALYETPGAGDSLFAGGVSGGGLTHLGSESVRQTAAAARSATQVAGAGLALPALPVKTLGAAPHPAKSKSLLPWMAGAALVVIGGLAAAAWVWSEPLTETFAQWTQKAAVTDPVPETPLVAKKTEPAQQQQQPKEQPADPPPSKPDPDPSPGPKPLSVPDGYPTLQQALAAAKAGESVRLKAGSYEGQVRLPEGVSLHAEEPGRVILWLEADVGSVLEIDSSSSPVRISGIVFTHEGERPGSGGAALVHVLSSAVTFEDCVFEKGVGAGLEVVGALPCQLNRCVARRNAGNGFLLRNTRLTAEACAAEGNGGNGWLVSGSGATVELKQPAAKRNGQSGIVIEEGARLILKEAEISENTENGVAAHGARGEITLQGGVINRNGVVFEGDRARDSGQGGVGLYADSGSTIQGEDVTLTENRKHGLVFEEPATGSALRTCKVIGSGLSGLVAFGGAQQGLLVEDCEFRRSGKHGLELVGAGFRPQLKGITVAESAMFGLVVLEGAEPQLSAAQFANNHGGDIDRAEAGPGMLAQP